MTIKIGELKAARAAMVGGTLSIGYATGDNTKDAAMLALRDGTIATMNAADVLIEIADCLLTRNAAAKEYAKAFHRWSQTNADREYEQQEAAHSALRFAADALTAALAKVTP